MAIYLLYMASPAILYVCMKFFVHQRMNRNDQLQKTFLIVFAVVMMMMIGLRHPSNGSRDTLFYFYQWESLGRVSADEIGYYLKDVDMEKGYLFLIWVLSHILKDGQWLLVLSGVFFAVSVCVFVRRNCSNPVLALLVFNCLGLFNFAVQGLRQTIAMCICLWAIEPCKKRELVRFLLLIALAAMFHASAVVFIGVYVLAKLKLDVRFLMVFAVGMLLVVMQLPKVFELMNRLLNDSYSLGDKAESGGWIAILISFAVVFFGVVYRDRSMPHYAMFIYMSLVGLECMFLRQSSSGIVERVGKYFLFADMVVVSNSVSAIRDKKVQIVVCIVVAVLCFFVAVHKASYSSLIPYRFYWQ